MNEQAEDGELGTALLDDGVVPAPRRRGRRTVKEIAAEKAESVWVKLLGRYQMAVLLPVMGAMAGVIFWAMGQVWDEARAYFKEQAAEIGSINEKLNQIAVNEAKAQVERDDLKKDQTDLRGEIKDLWRQIRGH